MAGDVGSNPTGSTLQQMEARKEGVRRLPDTLIKRKDSMAQQYLYGFWIRQNRTDPWTEVSKARFREFEIAHGFLPTAGFTTPGGAEGTTFRIREDDEKCQDRYYDSDGIEIYRCDEPIGHRLPHRDSKNAMIFYDGEPNQPDRLTREHQAEMESQIGFENHLAHLAERSDHSECCPVAETRLRESEDLYDHSVVAFLRQVREAVRPMRRRSNR